MSDTILSGDFTVYYLDESRRKQIRWTGSSGTYTMNQLYSALLDLFDESLQMDDGTPMSAQTPVEYTIGKIDPGDSEPWFIDLMTMQRLTGGALKSAGWARDLPGDGTGNIGIVVVAVTGSTIAGSDIGDTITQTSFGDTGTLLDVIEAGATDYLVIRPSSNALANDWDSTSGTIDMDGSAGTATQAAAGVTGEQIWANLYSIGTIEADTHIYVYQGAIADDSRARMFDITDSTQDWWSDGHINICVPIRDYTLADWTVIDNGYLTVLARKLTTLFDNFEVLTSIVSGGRNPIPLATAPDLDNVTGYKSITYTNASGNWSVGDEILGTDSGARGIITQIDSPGATQTVHYYLIDDPLTDFNSAVEVCDNQDDTGAGSKNGSAPADQGPGLATWFTNNAFPTIGASGHTHALSDVDDDGNDENYAVTVDCNQNPLSEVYEWLKYICRRGNVVTTDTDGLEAEQYIGGEVYLAYTGAKTGSILEGADVTQETSGATGIIQAFDTTDAAKVFLLRNTRGTFATHGTLETLTDNDNSGTVEIDSAAAAFSPKKQSPFGTFAGGTFFGARGVLLSDWITGDENSFILTPIEGGTKTRPVAIQIEVTNLIGTDETTDDDDRVAVFRLTGAGGNIDKTEFSAYAGEVPGDATLDVDTAIPADVPGKSAGGVLRIRDADDNNQEYRIRFSSWANNGGAGSDGKFTLANFTFDPTAGTNPTTVVASGGGFNAAVKRGDLVYNVTRSAVSYVVTVDNDTTLTIFPAIGSQTDTDDIEVNCVPITINTADDVFIPLLDLHAAAASAGVSIVYSTPIFFRVIVRNSGNATKIVPFATDDTTSGTDRSIPTIRTEDTIIS